MAIGIGKTGNTGPGRIKKAEAAGSAKNRGQTARTGQSQSNQQTDTVKLTTSATQLQELEARIADMPVVDVAQVDAMQMKVATGDYEVNEKRTANKLLDTEKKLSGA